MASDRGTVTQPKGRPPALFPLFAGIDTLPGIGPKGQAALAQMGIERPRDMVLTLPSGGITRRSIARVGDARAPEIVTLAVTVERHTQPSARGRPMRVQCRDDHGGDLTLVFFHPRKDWIERQLPLGQRRIVSGKLELFDGMAQIVHPDHILPEGEELPPAFEPVYPLSAGLTQKAMTKAAEAALTRLPETPEWIDPQVMAARGWPDFATALHQAHHPDSAQGLSPASPARARLAYDEFLAHQMTLALVRREKRRSKGRPSTGDGRLRQAVLDNLPWPPTNAQARAVREIAADMAGDHRMSRLLQGDVGAGKTLVAMLSALIAVEAGGQAVLMAPTEILARQHHATISRMAEAAGIGVVVLTARAKGRERADLLERIASGEAQIVIGTHALFQESVVYNNLTLAVVDEQHRFGVHQRLRLTAKGTAPHMLVMTATPIPRTLVLAAFGDMDVSKLTEKPAGRQPIATVTIPDDRLGEIVDRLKKALLDGKKAYWICPLVEDSDQSELMSVESRHASLAKAFGKDLAPLVSLVHGRMTSEEKDQAMSAFKSGQTRLLVATTVIEVGVDVPDATIMVIEHAERFGLAQLHQLRGRVGRGDGASSCILLYHGPLGETAGARLQVLRETEDGFRIAEEDLKLRGEGEVLGTRQSGMPGFRLANLSAHADLLEIARSDARNVLETDPALASTRGEALRMLLYLMRRDEAIRFLRAG